MNRKPPASTGEAASPRKPPGVSRADPDYANCYRYTREPYRQDMHLNHFLGADGLPGVLAFLDVGPHHQREYKGPEVRDVREWTELFRRLFLPYYEEARLHWSVAEGDGFFQDGNEHWIYLPDTLKRAIEQYGGGR
jgi:hypothetical protein